MGEPQTPNFYDFGTFGRVPEPRNQYYLSLETPGYLKQETAPIIFKSIILENVKNVEHPTT